MSLDNYNDYDSDDNRPKTPLEEDCCSSGCTPCIFDVHKMLLKEWENRKTHCKIENNVGLHLTPGQYVMLHSWSKSRPYTPITWTYKSLVFLVKLYKHGEFSLLLKNAPCGSTIDIRGPYGDFKYERNSFQQIVMFSIGSGIAALYPVAKAIVDDEMELTRVHLVAGFRLVEHVPLKKELTHLVDYWNFKCTLQLSQINGKTVNLHGFNINSGRFSKALVADYLQSNDTETTLILICGTPEFNQSMKEWLQEMKYAHIHIFE